MLRFTFNCGLKAYKKSVIKSIDIYGGQHRYIPALAGQRKFKITEIIVNHRARKFGSTKYGGKRLFHGFFDFNNNFIFESIQSTALHLFGAFGIGFFMIGFFRISGFVL